VNLARHDRGPSERGKQQLDDARPRARFPSGARSLAILLIARTAETFSAADSSTRALAVARALETGPFGRAHATRLLLSGERGHGAANSGWRGTPVPVCTSPPPSGIARTGEALRSAAARAGSGRRAPKYGERSPGPSHKGGAEGLDEVLELLPWPRARGTQLGQAGQGRWASGVGCRARRGCTAVWEHIVRDGHVDVVGRVRALDGENSRSSLVASCGEVPEPVGKQVERGGNGRRTRRRRTWSEAAEIRSAMLRTRAGARLLVDVRSRA